MRLWHESLIPILPSKQLLGQHRECCALRGLGWGRKHSTVDYVFTHPRVWLAIYHFKVMDEMTKRGYKVDHMWYSPYYRGKRCPMETELPGWEMAFSKLRKDTIVYPEHNPEYLFECLGNLFRKGVTLEFRTSEGDTYVTR